MAWSLNFNFDLIFIILDIQNICRITYKESNFNDDLNMKI